MTYRAELMSHLESNPKKDPSKGGFKTEGEAYEYIKSKCPLHDYSDEEDILVGYCTACEAEWEIFNENNNNTK